MSPADSLPSPTCTSVPAKMRTMLYKYPSAVTVMHTRSPRRCTVQAVMVRTVSPWAAALDPEAHSARKSCRPTSASAAACMAASSRCPATRWQVSKVKGSSTRALSR